MPVARSDLSENLIHWIAGETEEEAFEVLHCIVSEHRLLGGTGHIKGNYSCVCFTEAPQEAFHQVFGRYRPFGIEVKKRWAFECGGRPVIYQPESEYEALPDSHRWRHVRYEPDAAPPIDFSWEREWRIQASELAFHPGDVRIVVPDDTWILSLIREHEEQTDYRIQMEAIAYGQEWLMQNREPFEYSWTVIDV